MRGRWTWRSRRRIGSLAAGSASPSDMGFCFCCFSCATNSLYALSFGGIPMTDITRTIGTGRPSRRKRSSSAEASSR